MTADLVKDSLSAITTGAFVTEVEASMIATFERASARSSADMFGFNVVVQKSRGPKGPQFAFNSLSFIGFTLPCTASVATFVASTVEGGFAMSHALWLHFMALVTDR